jgi:capsular exopolysaccharide synthesis family protein
MIWANLSLATRGQREEDGTASRGGQVMLITSSLPGEGKSFTAAQLARNIAQSGKQVILVDADLRRPMQNRLFHMNETIGLANVLSGTASLDDALVDSGTENLTLLHCGTSSRNPTELISSEQMSALLEALRQEADVIIVDAPACAVVADALFIAPYIDTIVHVIGVGQVDSALVRDTTAALAAAAPKIMTYLLNRAPSGSSSPYKYYPSYSSWHSPRPMAAVAARSSASEADAVRTVRTPDAAANEGDENRTIRIYETGPDEPEKEIF